MGLGLRQGNDVTYAPGTVVSNFPLNLLFSSVFRGIPFPREQREAYNTLWHRHVKLHPDVTAAVQAVTGTCSVAAGGVSFAAAKTKIAVHVRVQTPDTEAGQLCAVLPSIGTYVAAVRRELRSAAGNGGNGGSGGSSASAVVYLSTDSSAAVAIFEEAFELSGADYRNVRLVVREGVKRTSGGVKAGASNEVRKQQAGCSREDARDVLVDMMCMAACDVLVHADSNVSRTAAIVNKDMRLVHV